MRFLTAALAATMMSWLGRIFGEEHWAAWYAMENESVILLLLLAAWHITPRMKLLPRSLFLFVLMIQGWTVVLFGLAICGVDTPNLAWWPEVIFGLAVAAWLRFRLYDRPPEASDARKATMGVWLLVRPPNPRKADQVFFGFFGAPAMSINVVCDGTVYGHFWGEERATSKPLSEVQGIASRYALPIRPTGASWRRRLYELKPGPYRFFGNNCASVFTEFFTYIGARPPFPARHVPGFFLMWFKYRTRS